MPLVLNLSRRPFTNRRPFWAVIVAVLLGCGGVAVWVNNKTSAANQRIVDMNRQLKSQQASFEAARKSREEREREDAKLQITPGETYELAEARQIIRTKAFSWDKLLSDIEAYIPQKAKVIDLKVERPQPGDNGLEAAIQVGALGESSAQMTELMDNFAKSGGLFTVNDVSQGQMDDTGHVPFAIKVEYHPWAGPASAAGVKQ